MFVSPRMPMSRAASPTPSRTSGDGYANLQRSPSMSEFQIEKSPKPRMPQPNIRRSSMEPAYQDELMLRESVNQLLITKDRQFAVSGRIPLDSSQLVLFFRSKSGITHSLDFPIDVDYNTPPALDVLIAACRPHQTSDVDDYTDRESLFYPTSLPLTTSVEIANHPILDAIRNALFPNLPAGHYLTAVRDKLEVLVNGGRMGRQSVALRGDGRSATIIVTLPVRYKGGTLVVHEPEGNEEKYNGRGGRNGDLEWTAFLADCDYEIETVQRGCRLSIAYGVYLKTFACGGNAAPLVGAGVSTDPLINPSDNFFDLVAPVLNMSRGRRIAFYLTHDYGVNPSDVLAETLAPQLKGGDYLLYNALKLYKLTPELRWSAGGMIWPVNRTVELFGHDIVGHQASAKTPTSMSTPGRMPFANLNNTNARNVGGVPPLRGSFGTYSDAEDEVEALRMRCESSGAVPFAEAEISVMTEWGNPNPVVGKERVPFVSAGELERLVVNVLIVVYVP